MREVCQLVRAYGGVVWLVRDGDAIGVLWSFPRGTSRAKVEEFYHHLAGNAA
jgi:hypothetical protein